MIGQREAELIARRATLRERIAQERTRISEAARPLVAACVRMDQLRTTAAAMMAEGRQWVARHPLWLVAAVAFLIAARPRRTLRWTARLVALWRGYLGLRRVLDGWLTARGTG